MSVREAYDQWSATYDVVANKTRDTEAAALRASIAGEFSDVLEIGCGTGKNTAYLLTKAGKLVAADFSAEMLARARAKIAAETIEFRRMDLREAWNFSADAFDLIVCSLALEHLENLDFVFAEARRVLRPGGLFYLGELHPFKQYRGSRARFETEAGVYEIECYTHHVSEYFAAATNNRFACVELKEWFDDDDRTGVPRVLTMIFRADKL